MRWQAYAVGLTVVGAAFGISGAQAQITVAALDPAHLTPTACRIEAARGVDFGAGGRRFSQPIDAEGALSLACSRATPFTLALASGGGPGAMVAARRMPGPCWTWFVAYGLFKDRSRTELWGDSGESLVAGIADEQPQTLSVYGRVPPQPAPPDGAYSDLVAVTISY